MTQLSQDAISVIISTFERPDACERALRSALDQTDRPLEVLICDNGSADETEHRFREWERRCEAVRYLRVPSNSGSPAPARNLGIAGARGAWIGFLDDDDEWLPEKLERQRAAIAAEAADLVAANALRSSGGLYFQHAPPIQRPTRADVLRANPFITSTVLVKRELAAFPTARWLRGVEDYAAWLALADRGARFVILGEPLARYEDSSGKRLSAARARGEFALARLAWRRAIKLPLEAVTLSAAARKTAGAACVAASDGVAVLRARKRHKALRS